MDLYRLQGCAPRARKTNGRRLYTVFVRIGNEEPRSKLLGIFGGEEIYYTGVVHTPSRKSVYNIFGGEKFSGASSGVWTTPSNQHGFQPFTAWT
jgi:hypothetical protein